MPGEEPNSSPVSGAAPGSKGGEAEAHHAGGASFWGLALGAVGVVFGDIGTSPLYAYRQALDQAIGPHGLTPDAVLGVVSLALWALILIVTIKYVIFLMRADNRGEGGVLSLMALAQAAIGRRTLFIFALGVTGAALFYGDSIITPAMSVLSAVEGLNTVPALKATVEPGGAIVLIVSLAILMGLFAVQFRGTEKVAGFFGPVLVLWFVVISVFGVMHIVHAPRVLLAISPTFAVGFLVSHGLSSFLVLGSVFLTVTGAEALYADMGHFGRWPIQASWLFLGLPCLMVNYLGQAAFALETIANAHGQPVGDTDWFFQMAPEALRVPLVILATAATVIASQAVITGAYSLTNQAMQLGLLPRMVVKRTSETQAGQIYLPQINAMLAVGVVLLIGVFKSSDNLGQAYGLAVTGTMAVTTTLAFIVVTRQWGWPRLGAALLIGPMLSLDLVFLSANSLKLLSGGALPLVFGAAIIFVMATWVRGNGIVNTKLQADTPPLEEFIALLAARPPHRVAGTAVYLTADPSRAPGALLHNLKHNKVLHDHNIILTVRTAEIPRVPEAERLSLETLDDSFQRVIIRYGFMETPNVPRALTAGKRKGLVYEAMSTSFFLGRKTVVASLRKGVGRLQDRLFILLSKNSANPTDFFQIPPGRVLEMGGQVSV